MSSASAVSPSARRRDDPAGWPLRTVVRILAAVLRVITRREWRGTEHVPAGPLVMVANHISYFDFLPFGHFVYGAGRWPHYLAKESVFRIPVLGALIRACEQIPVHRRSARAGDALASAVAAVERGHVVMIYPEGTVTKDPAQWPMRGHSGAVRVALQTGCPLVPVAQWGAQEVMPGPMPGVPRLLPRKTMRVVAGPPIDLSAYVDRPLTAALLVEATELVMSEITALLAELRGEPAPAGRYHPTGDDPTGGS
ncbi:lysophospholipid acyltransferase family protein [Microlunatus sp. Y2014]|uniref:lysophospholipid acyltransferase family protein n=1 Tax=Microlunatus sp. Y2014 TaxID=3418488 RepID=UPI003DA7A6DC